MKRKDIIRSDPYPQTHRNETENMGTALPFTPCTQKQQLGKSCTGVFTLEKGTNLPAMSLV